MSTKKEKHEEVELEKFASPFGHPQQAQQHQEVKEADKKQKHAPKTHHDKAS